MLISSTHPFFTTSQEINEILKPLNSLGISYFSYSRSNTLGERIYLLSHPRRLEVYLAEKEYLIGNTESHPLHYQPQIVLWSCLPKQQLYDNGREMNIDHGIYIIAPNNDYCEYFGFATTTDNHKIINTYLSNMELLKNFTAYFKEKANPIIKKALKHKITLPFHQDKLDFLTNASEINNVKNAIVNIDQCYFSKNQKECIRLYVQGKTAKEVARVLGLSYRTVENYLQKIKNQLNVSSKTELIHKTIHYFQ